MNGRWIKVVIFVLLIIMVTSVVSALLDPGLGKPDNDRRIRHLAGFSIACPRGWGGTAYGSPDTDQRKTIRLAQERKTGPETVIAVVCSGAKADSHRNTTEGTFQGQPAFYSTTNKTPGWQWRVQFEREDNWYEIVLSTPIPLEVQKSPYWPFIESFRIEKQIRPTTLELPTTSAPPPSPATVPSH